MAQPTISSLTVPGQPLGTTSKYTPGPGAHVSGTTLASSIIGQAVSSSKAKGPSNAPTITILRPTFPPSRPQPHLPAVGSRIYCRITRLAQSTAHAAILVVDDIPVAGATGTALAVAASSGGGGGGGGGFRGILRSIDVRATEKDKVRLADCFRVGDVVRAVVISMGDQGGYFLSTAGNEFGVVMAWSEEGNAAVPVSWNEVMDEVTGAREGRKVAKPF